MYQKKIVVLDSNTDTAREVSDRLKADGFDVCAVSDDGNEGVRLVEECKPDAVVVGACFARAGRIRGFGSYS